LGKKGKDETKRLEGQRERGVRNQRKTKHNFPFIFIWGGYEFIKKRISTEIGWMP